MGLWLAPDIPPDKLRAAIGDYARGVAPGEVLALFDGTRFGSARDGILFLADRLVAQASDLEAPRTIRYAEVVGARRRRRLLGGSQVAVELGRGRTTVTETLDFSVHGAAAEHVERFLEHTLLAAPSPAGEATDAAAVAAALERLVADGRLNAADRDRMIAALGGDGRRG